MLIFFICFMDPGTDEKEFWERAKKLTIEKKEWLLGLDKLSEKKLTENEVEFRIWVETEGCYVLRKKGSEWQGNFYPSDCYDKKCGYALEPRISEDVTYWESENHKGWKNVELLFEFLDLKSIKDIYEIPKKHFMEGEDQIASVDGVTLVVEMNYSGHYRSVLLLPYKNPEYDFDDEEVENWFYLGRSLYHGLRGNLERKLLPK